MEGNFSVLSGFKLSKGFFETSQLHNQKDIEFSWYENQTSQ